MRTDKDDVYRALASAQAERWGYTHTLDPQELSAYIDERSQDANLRADVDAVTALIRDQAAALATGRAEVEGCTHGGDCQVHPGVQSVHNYDPDQTPDCYDCGRQWADCTCEGPQS